MLPALHARQAHPDATLARRHGACHTGRWPPAPNAAQALLAGQPHCAGASSASPSSKTGPAAGACAGAGVGAAAALSARSAGRGGVCRRAGAGATVILCGAPPPEASGGGGVASWTRDSWISWAGAAAQSAEREALRPEAPGATAGVCCHSSLCNQDSAT
jgi:hypothetical protein